MDYSLDRRQCIRQASIVGTIGMAGCLRLQSNDEQSSEDTKSTSLSELVETEWNIEQTPRLVSTNNGYLYGDNGEFIKVDTSNGELLWEKRPDGRYYSDLVAVDDYLFTLQEENNEGDIPTRLIAMDTSDGTQRWSSQGIYTEVTQRNHLTASNDHVAFVEQNQSYTESILRCFNTNSNEPLWENNYSHENGGSAYVYLRDGMLYLLDRNAIRVIDPETGEVEQSQENYNPRGTVTATSVYTGGSTIIKYRRSDLEPQWEYELPTWGNGMPSPDSNGFNGTSDEDILIVPSRIGIHCLDADSGELRWEYETVDEVNDESGGIEYIDSTVFAVDRSGYLYIIDATTGEVRFESQEGFELATNESSLFLSFQSEESSESVNGTSAVSVLI